MAHGVCCVNNGGDNDDGGGGGDGDYQPCWSQLSILALLGGSRDFYWGLSPPGPLSLWSSQDHQLQRQTGPCLKATA